MKKVRQGLLPVFMALAPLTYAAASPTTVAQARFEAGSNVAGRAPVYTAFRDGISLDEAVARAEQQYRARVVRTDVVDEDGRKVYVLKLLSEDGRVFTVRIDAATGRMR